MKYVPIVFPFTLSNFALNVISRKHVHISELFINRVETVKRDKPRGKGFIVVLIALIELARANTESVCDTRRTSLGRRWKITRWSFSGRQSLSSKRNKVTLQHPPFENLAQWSYPFRWKLFHDLFDCEKSHDRSRIDLNRYRLLLLLLLPLHLLFIRTFDRFITPIKRTYGR